MWNVEVDSSLFVLFSTAHNQHTYFQYVWTVFNSVFWLFLVNAFWEERLYWLCKSLSHILYVLEYLTLYAQFIY